MTNDCGKPALSKKIEKKTAIVTVVILLLLFSISFHRRFRRYRWRDGDDNRGVYIAARVLLLRDFRGRYRAGGITVRPARRRGRGIARKSLLVERPAARRVTARATSPPSHPHAADGCLRSGESLTRVASSTNDFTRTFQWRHLVTFGRGGEGRSVPYFLLGTTGTCPPPIWPPSLAPPWPTIRLPTKVIRDAICPVFSLYTYISFSKMYYLKKIN